MYINLIHVCIVYIYIRSACTTLIFFLEDILVSQMLNLVGDYFIVDNAPTFEGVECDVVCDVDVRCLALQHCEHSCVYKCKYMIFILSTSSHTMRGLTFADGH